MSDSRRSVAFVWHARLEDFITQVAWSPDGAHLAATGVSGQLFIWDAAGKIRHRIEPAHRDGCDALAWRPDGAALATAGRDGKWRLWNAADGGMMVECEAGAAWPEHAVWGADPGKRVRLALSAGNKVSLWDEQGAPVNEPIAFPRPVAELAWTTGGRFVVAWSSGVSVREGGTGAEQNLFTARDPILAMALSPSARWLMTGNQDCSVHVWNIESGVEMHMRGFPAKVRQLAWHRGSRWLATGGGPTIAVWDCSGRGPEGRTPTLLEWHEDQVTALHYQPAGDWLASGARDGSVAVWSPTQRETLVTGAKIAGGVTRVAWSPDGARLAVGGENGEVQVLAVE
jgi:WD40 repeat protein